MYTKNPDIKKKKWGTVFLYLLLHNCACISVNVVLRKIITKCVISIVMFSMF